MGKLAQSLRGLVAGLGRPLICYNFSSDKPDEETLFEHLDVGWSVLEVAAIRAKKLIADGFLAPDWGRVRRAPPTIGGVKAALKIKYSIDELHAIGVLQSLPPTAANVIMEFAFTRDVIRKALGNLGRCRKQQLVMRPILCATRLKFYEAGDLCFDHAQKMRSGG